MRIFVYEHVTGGGMAAVPLPTSLEREGWAMLASIVSDLSRVNGVESVATTLDRRLAGRAAELRTGGVEVEAVGASEIDEAFERLAVGCGAALVIAPEIDGALVHWTRRAEAAGARILGSSPGAIELASDKLALSRRLFELGVPAVPLVEADRDAGPPRSVTYPSGTYHSATYPGTTYPGVIKPRRGAGSLWNWRIEDERDAGRVFAEAVRAGAPRELTFGPFVPGLPASIAFLGGRGRLEPLLPGLQVLSTDGRFRYQGGRMPLPEPLAARARSMASRAAAAVPGLAGYFGVDLILDPDPLPGRAPRDVVVEINARLTTSYLGLRALARGNLAAAWLDLWSEVDAPPLEWYGGAIAFQPDGSVHFEEEKTEH